MPKPSTQPPPLRTPLPTRLHLALLLGGLLAAPATACDTVLLELILARDRTSRFEEQVKSLSKMLLDMGSRARNRGGKGVNYLRSVFTRTWGHMYEKYYLDPPPGHEQNPIWRNLCDNVTARAEGLRRLVRDEEWEALHDGLRATQEALTAFYLPAPRPGEPKTEFDVARTLLAGLKRVVEGDEPVAADLRSNLQHLEKRIRSMEDAGVVPTDTPAARGYAEALEGFRRVAADGAQTEVRSERLEALRRTVEQLRSEVLERQWFDAPPGLARAEAAPSDGPSPDSPNSTHREEQP